MRSNQHKASFRDPSGFIFSHEGVLFRQVNRVYQSDYELLMSSGLYRRLTQAGMLVAHEEVDSPVGDPSLAFRVIKPQRVDWISYPYEWCFSQLKDAALLTLTIQKEALACGMSLKDASAYNVQFHQGKPVLIDTLSFERREPGKPWVAYRQFCRHFLAPLALMAHTDVRLNQLARLDIDGVPLDLASRLLPFGTRFNFGLMAHIHLHAGAQKQFAGRVPQGQSEQVGRSPQVSEQGMIGLIESLEKTVQSLTWQPKGTDWGSYYEGTNYSTQAFSQKEQTVSRFIEQIQPRRVWDLGANTGVFSRLAARAGALTIAADIDPAAVEKNYRSVRQNKETNLLPLIIDLTNPSPAIGWQNAERAAFLERGPVDAVMALALIHHLCISNNVPLPQLADFFAGLGRWLIIEFVPKSDSQVQRLLSTRVDIFSDYTREGFETAFSERFAIREAAPVEGSERTLYLMEAL